MAARICAKPRLTIHAFQSPETRSALRQNPLANAVIWRGAYSPGVAEACLEIKADPTTAALYTTRRELVGGFVTTKTAPQSWGLATSARLRPSR